jgi:hypothetical protein
MADQHHSVFLSHNSVDKPAVEALARQLIASGIQPWLDTWNLIPGEPWQEAIEHALGQCTACAVFIGPSSAGPWQNEEMRVAISRRVAERGSGFRVIPVLLPGAERGERSKLPSFLQATTWVEFRTTLDDEHAFHLLLAGIRGVAPGPSPGATVNQSTTPYRGLQVFDVNDWAFFFGREALTEWLINTLRPTPATHSENRFLGIIGPSGSGKSSLARAGLAATLHRGTIIDSQEWPIVIFKPGVDPLESLAIALSDIIGSGRDPQATLALIGALSDSERALHLQTRLALREAPPARRLVLLIDQFEEVFTLCHDDRIRHALIENLLYAANVAQGQTVVLLTLRADFYGQCAAYPALAAALSEHQMLVGPMTQGELQQAIERPALLAGCEFEPGLVETLIDDVQGQPGALPLLQHALLELWNRREGRRLTHAAYHMIGGVEGALEQRAEAVYASFSAPEQMICRRIFLRLTQPGEGTEDTRRRASLQELLPAGGDSSALDEVVHTLAGTDARLVITEGSDEHTQEQFVEVAHEALIRSWPRLRSWIDQNRAALRTQRRLTEAAREWESNQRDASYLYQGARLAVAQEWAVANKDDLNDIERAFLDASGSASTAARRRAQRRVQLTVGGMAVALVLISVFLGLALVQNNQIAKAARLDRGRILVEQGRRLAERQPLLGLRLALEGFALTPVEETSARESMGGVIEEMSRQGRLLNLGDDVKEIFGSTDWSRFAVTYRQQEGQPKYGELRRTTDGTLVTLLPGVVDQVFFGLNPAAPCFAVIYSNRQLGELRRMADGTLIATLPESVAQVFFSPDPAAMYFVVNYTNGRPGELRRSADGTLITALAAEVNRIEFSPDPVATFFVVYYSESSLPTELRRSANGTRVAEIMGSVSFSESSTAPFFIVAYDPFDGRPPELHRTDDGAIVRQLTRPIALVAAANPYFVVAYADNTPAELRRLSDGEIITKLTGARVSVTFSWDKAASYFVANYADNIPSEVRRSADGVIITTLPGLSTNGSSGVVFSGNAAAPVFAVYYGSGRPTEVRRITDGSIITKLAGIDTSISFSSDPAAAFFTTHFDFGTPVELHRTADGSQISAPPGAVARIVVGPNQTATFFVVYYGPPYPAPGDSRDPELRRISDGALIRALPGVTDQIFFDPDQTTSVFVVRYQDGRSELWDAQGMPHSLLDLGYGIVFRSPSVETGYVSRPDMMLNTTSQRIILRYTSDQAYVFDVGWLKAISELQATLSPEERTAELIRLACQGPLASGLFDESELTPYLGEQPAQACR